MATEIEQHPFAWEGSPAVEQPLVVAPSARPLTPLKLALGRFGALAARLRAGGAPDAWAAPSRRDTAGRTRPSRGHFGSHGQPGPPARTRSVQTNRAAR